MNNFRRLLFLSLVALNISCVSSTDTSKTDEDFAKNDRIDPKDLIEKDTSRVNTFYQEENYKSDQIDSLGIELMSISDIGGIEIGMNPDEVKSIIGEPEAISIAEVWDVDGGEHTFWYYCDSSLVLEFVNYSFHEDNALEIIELKDSCEVFTDRGITIGSPLNLVKSRYAKALKISNWKEGQDQILLGDAGMGGLFFTICGEVICNIRIGAIIRC